MENMLRLGKENDMQQETEKVLDTLWSISKQYFPFARSKFEKGPQSNIVYKADNRVPNDCRDVIDYNKKE